MAIKFITDPELERFAAIMANFVTVMGKLDKIEEELERLADMEPKVARPPRSSGVFDKKAYQREYMRKRRAKNEAR